MNILPLKNKVLVERLENINTTSSGLILSSSQEPDKAKISTTTGDEIIDHVPITGWPFFSLSLSVLSEVSIDSL